MDLPQCPQDYTCTFTPVHPRTIYHTVGPWWQHTAGWIVLIVAILAVTFITVWVIEAYAASRRALRDKQDEQLERANKLAIEEQRTYQIDASKGNPELLKILKKDKL